MNRTAVLVIVAVLCLAVGFGGGYLVASKVTPSSSSNGANAGRNGPGGAFAQLSAADRQQLQNMTPEQRQQFLQSRGINIPQGGGGSGAPTGTPGGAGFTFGGGGAPIEGTIATVAPDRITVALANGSSIVVYTDKNTVKASVSGKKPDLVQGAKVLVYASQEAQGVRTARAVVVE